MHEDVGVRGVDLDALDRRGVAGVDDPATGAILPHDLLGRDAVDRLAALQAAEVRALGDPEGARGLDVEAPGPVVLDEGVAVGLDAVVDRERGDHEVAEADLLVVLELDHVQGIPGPPDDRSQRLPEELLQAGRAEDVQRPVAVAHVEGLDHPRQPEPVVEVQVGDEDRVQLRQPDRAQQLVLGPLAAVEQDPLAARAQQDRGQAAPRRGNGAGGAGEEQGQVHRPGEASAVRGALGPEKRASEGEGVGCPRAAGLPRACDVPGSSSHGGREGHRQDTGYGDRGVVAQRRRLDTSAVCSLTTARRDRARRSLTCGQLVSLWLTN